MQAIMEPLFHVVYLTTVIILGIKMLSKSKDNQYFKLFGKLVTSITMTIFYLILYKIWKFRFDVKNSKTLDKAMYILVGLRVILCLFPQNQ